MSAKAVSLENVLARHEIGRIELDHVNANDLKPAARFWFGPAANKFRKDECIKALTGLFRDRTRLEAGLHSLPEDERKVLAVFKRYGGAMSGELLRMELVARGLVQKTDPEEQYYGGRRTKDPVHDLSAKLVLISPSGGYSRYGYYYGSYQRRYPDLVVAPGVLDLVEPAAPWIWRASAPAAAPTATSQRSPAEVALDLWTLAQALQQGGTWKTNRGSTPAKSVQNRLAKLFVRDEADPLLPSAPEGLYYELLRGLGAIRVDGDQGHISLPAVERLLHGSGVVQSWQWVRAWLRTRLWQDGIGLVPDRDRYDDPVRIEPHSLATARELVTWALSAVAHGADGWLDLETFLTDFWAVMGQDSIDFYWGRYSWQPKFKLSRNKDRITAIPARMRAFWLDNEGTWAANAILGTLAYLGLVERGHGGADWDDRPCFRLTATGKAVFGAPELAAEEPAHDPKFLTVQPNFDVQVYLNVADASAVWPLSQMARRTSTGGGLVQTFALTRESVYQALESGLSVEAIHQFLQDHGRTELPDNVARSLAEWGRRREALVLRTDTVLAACPPGQADRLPEAARGRRIGDQFALLPKSAGRSVRPGVVRNWQEKPPPSWRVDDEGRVRVGPETDSVARARLTQFADGDDDGWRITAASVHRARDRGIPVEQILEWLSNHLANELPAILETAIRNWSGSARVFFGNLLMLQVPQPQAWTMIRTSRQFRPLLVGPVPPDWFIVRPDKQGEVERLLAELGFTVGAAVQLWEEAEDRSEARASSSRKPGRRGRRARSED